MTTVPLAGHCMNALSGQSNWTTDIIPGHVEDSEPSRTKPDVPGDDPTY